ncbi:sulfite exporter TauE/SafE family protein [Candidatus Halobeggiatoa sp. HSG11]|nr:sulfite exporter TauE/SafE family protein [Candidatus Halobeggiatoa sp. HSG11]
MTLTLLSAFIAGLVGSTHCVGMCGGIVGILTMSLSNNVRQSYLRLIPYLLGYNLGRITSYVVAGILVGFLGGQFTQWLPFSNPSTVAKWISGLFMIALGLYIGAWWQILTILERAGTSIWNKIKPFGEKFLPVQNPLQALGLGLVWGWLPCGLVYAVLSFAFASKNAWDGGLLMLAFGLGTLPMLLTIGAAAQWITKLSQNIIVRRIAGMIIISFGLMMLFMPHHH